MKATEENPVFFVDENYERREMKGGFFLRNSLKEFFQKLEDAGETPVAIKFDGSFNLEILVIPKE